MNDLFNVAVEIFADFLDGLKNALSYFLSDKN